MGCSSTQLKEKQESEVEIIGTYELVSCTAEFSDELYIQLKAYGDEKDTVLSQRTHTIAEFEYEEGNELLDDKQLEDKYVSKTNPKGVYAYAKDGLLNIVAINTIKMEIQNWVAKMEQNNIFKCTYSY